MMLKKLIMRVVIILFSCVVGIPSAFAVTEINFWHAMGGQLGDILNKIITQFNQSQSDYHINSIYKGDYSETLTATIAAFRAHKQPHVTQVFEIGTATMINPPGLIVPVSQLMHDANITFNENDFLPIIKDYYSDKNGHLLAMPFNSSSAVLYYNKELFSKASINPPTTWENLVSATDKLFKVGAKCGFTTGWPAWTQVETFSAWHNLPFATQNNGFDNLDVKLLFNNPTVIQQINTLADWQKKHIFKYGGRGDQAMVLFTSGQCAMIIESSGAMPDLLQFSRFPIGIAALPYWSSVKGAPQNTSIGGAALWALSGHSKVENDGVAKFFAFLAKPEIQTMWQQATGYLPVTQSAITLNKTQGYFDKNKGAEIAVKELLNKPPTNNSRGFRLGNYPAIRTLIEEKLESALSGQMNAQTAMNDAVTKGNQLLQQFRQNVSGEKN